MFTQNYQIINTLSLILLFYPHIKIECFIVRICNKIYKPTFIIPAFHFQLLTTAFVHKKAKPDNNWFINYLIDNLTNHFTFLFELNANQSIKNLKTVHCVKINFKTVKHSLTTVYLLISTWHLMRPFLLKITSYTCLWDSGFLNRMLPVIS